MQQLRLIFFLIVFMLPATAFSIPNDSAVSNSDCKPCNPISLNDASDLLKPLKLNVKSIKRAPMSRMFEVLAERDGSEGLIYIDCDKKFFMQGVIVDANKMEVVSSHPVPKPNEKKTAVIDPKAIPVNRSIVLGNPNGSKKIYVFTDPDCPYCRTLHTELLKLVKIAPEVTIHILLYPLPTHPQAYDKTRLLVSSQDLTLLNMAFEGKDLPKTKGDEGKDAIDEIIKFGRSIGVRGTPTIVLPTGAILAGASDAESLNKHIFSHGNK